LGDAFASVLPGEAHLDQVVVEDVAFGGDQQFFEDLSEKFV
jgi:hypothetical protein